MKMKIFSDLSGYNEGMCQHVYKFMNPGPCGSCGLTTNDPDWDKVNLLYSTYREKVGYFYNTSTWWSI